MALKLRVRIRQRGNPFVIYQAHRALLWAGDIEVASELARILQSSDLPKVTQLFVSLRQACAENRTSDAVRIYETIITEHSNITSHWIVHSLMGQQEKAFDTLVGIDDPNLSQLGRFQSYTYCDARLFPNFLTLLETQGIEPREPQKTPCGCKM
jgi:hypothetical protein